MKTVSLVQRCLLDPLAVAGVALLATSPGLAATQIGAVEGREFSEVVVQQQIERPAKQIENLQLKQLPAPGETTIRDLIPNLAAFTLGRMAQDIHEAGVRLRDIGPGPMTDLLQNYGLGGSRTGAREVGRFPNPAAGSGSGLSSGLPGNLDPGLPSNPKGPLDNLLRSPDPRQAMSGAASKGGTQPTATVVPGTHRSYPAEPGATGRADSVLLTDGTTVIVGVETRSDGTVVTHTATIDAEGNRKSTDLVVTRDGRAAVITSRETATGESQSTHAQGDADVIAAERERRREQEDTARTQDPDSGSVNGPWGYYNPFTGQYWGPRRTSSPNQINPGPADAAITAPTGPRLQIDPNSPVINPSPEASPGIGQPKLRRPEDAGPQTPGGRPPDLE